MYGEDGIDKSMSDDDYDGGWGGDLSGCAKHLKERWGVGLEFPAHESGSGGIAYFNSPPIVISE